MKRLLYLLLLSAVAMLVLVPAAWAQGQTVTVSMEDNRFVPANITVEPGTTVTWVQNGSNPHTTTSYDGLWDSGLIEGGSGGSYSFTFNEPGTYDYYCQPHEDLGMVGTVTVSGGGAAAQETTAQAPATGAQQVPDTGGPSLVLLAAFLFSCSGALGLTLLRRRMS